jgi:hypothetical protein
MSIHSSIGRGDKVQLGGQKKTLKLEDLLSRMRTTFQKCRTFRIADEIRGRSSRETGAAPLWVSRVRVLLLKIAFWSGRTMTWDFFHVERGLADVTKTRTLHKSSEGCGTRSWLYLNALREERYFLLRLNRG